MVSINELVQEKQHDNVDEIEQQLLALPNRPLLTDQGRPVHHTRNCRECQNPLYLHDVVEHFDNFNGGHLCNACFQTNPIECSVCQVTFQQQDLVFYDYINGACCRNCTVEYHRLIRENV